MTPAQAGGVGWNDPAGDATAMSFEGVRLPPTPRPSDPQLDIRAVSFAVEGDSIVASASMEAGGFAVASGGSGWRFFFSHKNDRYFFQAAASTTEFDPVHLSTPRFYRVKYHVEGAEQTWDIEELRCDCKTTVNVKAGKVRFVTKTAAVARTLKVPVGSIELKELELVSNRRTGYCMMADVAPAPAGMVFRA